MLRRSIDAYLQQSHPDRELVVVVDGGPEPDRAAVAAMVRDLGRSDIKLVLAAPGLSLGALRNLSVGCASADIICQWDDDDFHHRDRISIQLDALEASGKDATILQDVLIYRPDDRAIYWTNWANTPAGGHPATLMCSSKALLRYPEEGPQSRRGEDLAVIAPLCASGVVHRQTGAPWLYVYVTHQSNTCDPAHHDMLVDSLSISPGLLRRREAAIRNGLAEFDLGSGQVTLTGSSGPAFTL
jgi:glycosyltransferase involved in cell wall biosynthesis